MYYFLIIIHLNTVTSWGLVQAVAPPSPRDSCSCTIVTPECLSRHVYEMNE